MSAGGRQVRRRLRHQQEHGAVHRGQRQAAPHHGTATLYLLHRLAVEAAQHSTGAVPVRQARVGRRVHEQQAEVVRHHQRRHRRAARRLRAHLHTPRITSLHVTTRPAAARPPLAVHKPRAPAAAPGTRPPRRPLRRRRAPPPPTTRRHTASDTSKPTVDNVRAFSKEQLYTCRVLQLQWTAMSIKENTHIAKLEGMYHELPQKQRKWQ